MLLGRGRGRRDLLGCLSTWRWASVAPLPLGTPALVKLPAKADSLLLRRLLEQCLVGVTVYAVENVDVSRGGCEAFACPGEITAQAVSTILSVVSGRYPCWRQSFPIKGNNTVPPPFSLRVTPLSSTAYGWLSCAKEVSETRL